MVEPNLTFDAFHSDQEYLYAEWMLDLKDLSRDLIRLLKVHRIEFIPIKHRYSNNRHKRNTVSGSQSDFKLLNQTAINDTNIIDGYYSVNSVPLFKYYISIFKTSKIFFNLKVYTWIKKVSDENSKFVKIVNIGRTYMNTTLKVLKVRAKFLLLDKFGILLNNFDT